MELNELPLIALLVLSQASPALAQRQWGPSDSTSYNVGGDTLLIASRKQLYRALPGDTILLRDFTDPNDDDLYIRDVDHWSSSDFYVIVGSRYIGWPTVLYRSTDAGATWAEDSSFFDAAMEQPSLNQMAILGDTAYLFNAYYISEELRSFDRGATWQFWFRSYMSHYYGIIPCGESAYIFGMQGDGFQASMWARPDSLWDMQIETQWCTCSNACVTDCYDPPFPQNEYALVVDYFQQTVDALCAQTTLVREVGTPIRFELRPTLATERITLLGAGSADEISVWSAAGRWIGVERVGNTLEIDALMPGAYFVSRLSAGSLTTARFVKE